MRDYPELPQLTGERMEYTKSYLNEPPINMYPFKLLPLAPPEVRGEDDIASASLTAAEATHTSAHTGPTLILSPSAGGLIQLSQMPRVSWSISYANAIKVDATTCHLT